MRKKGQITFFIIIAVIIVIGLILFFVIKPDVKKTKISSEISSIHNFVENCVEETGEEAIYHIGQTGGYFTIPELSFEQAIAYYLYENENNMPLKEKIEEEISLYMDFIMPFCINDFEDFLDFKITSNEIKTTTKIENEKVVFNVNYLLSIVKDKKSYILEDFDGEIAIRLGIIYNAITEAMDEQMKKTDAVCVDCLYDIGQKYDLKFHVLKSDETGALLFIVRDENSKVFDEDYKFHFVNKLEVVG